MSDVDEAYSKWTIEPTPDNMASVLNTLTPTINSEITRYQGPKPLLRSEAKKLAIGAIKTYDPMSKAKLRSWVTTQMQPLTRYSREVTNPLHVSELAVRQAAEVEQARKDILEENGQDPTDDELSDHVGISVKRIQKIRNDVKPVAYESAFESAGDGDSSVDPSINIMGTDPSVTAATELVLASLDDRDRMIFVHKTGHQGAEELDNQSIAARLGVSPAFISQRSEAISKMILETTDRV